MTFPKPLVILGFALIFTAVSGGIYKEYFQPRTPAAVRSDKKKVATLVVEQIFEKLRDELQNSSDNFNDDHFAEFKKNHLNSYVVNYLVIASELATGKYSKEEALEKDKEFNEDSVKTLSEIYARRYSSPQITEE